MNVISNAVNGGTEGEKTLQPDRMRNMSVSRSEREIAMFQVKNVSE